MTRSEKLFNMQAQVQKAVSEIYHGDHAAVELAFADALAAMLRFLEEELPEKPLEKALDLGVNFPMPREPEVKEILKHEAESEILKKEAELEPPKPESESVRIGRIKVPKK
jgi:hypothetical protein